MFKKIIPITAIGMAAFSAPVYSDQSDFITCDWLMMCSKNTMYTDHVPHFRHLFNTIKVNGFLECGCGFSTKYFIDNAQKVISIEFMTPGTGDFLYNEAKRLFSASPNWTSTIYNADLKNESFNNACAYQYITHKDYALIDSHYVSDLEKYLKTQLETARQDGHAIDVAFVDPSVCVRGDMVKIFLENKVPIIVAHDTATDSASETTEGLYEWFKVKTPSDYEKISLPFGQGTTFWISKNLSEVIDSMQKYRDRLFERGIKGALKIEELKEIADQK